MSRSLKTFSITTLGCRVNHYESEQLATLLRQRGLTQSYQDDADLRIVHTCSVTIQAASKSRQTVRRATRLPIFTSAVLAPSDLAGQGSTNPEPQNRSDAKRPKVIVTGCWATSDAEQASAIPGVDAVLGHHHDVNAELNHLLTQWGVAEGDSFPTSLDHNRPISPKPGLNEIKMIKKAGTSAGLITPHNQPQAPKEVNGKLESDEDPCEETNRLGRGVGTIHLPLLADRQSTHQRAFLKIQDGCDAHCTYCIIPQLRPNLWSKPIQDALEEARRLVEAGHSEIILTGIFLGAYGHPTALRRRQLVSPTSLHRLIEALCTKVPGLHRIRLSSLEPGDLTPELIAILKSHPQVVPHFHLPLQSGSDKLLRKMNRQYTRDDYLRMLDRVNESFDRPAITTDIIVGFPGETDAEFNETIDLVNRARFIHIHAFSYSPRPKTAAARWTRAHIQGPVVNQRIHHLRRLAAQHSLTFRRQFLNQTVEVLVENPTQHDQEIPALAHHQHGRCERYFPVHVPSKNLPAGTRARVRIEQITPDHTLATFVS